MNIKDSISAETPKERSKNKQFIISEPERIPTIKGISHNTEGKEEQSPLKKQLNLITVKQPAILVYSNPANVKAYLQEHPIK